MYKDNLIVDYENSIKIPQNEREFYEINQSLDLNYSIEVVIKPFDDINTINLFLIIKSYLNNLIYIPHMLLIMVKKNNENFVAHSLNSSYFKEMSYLSFAEWFYKNLKEDWMYMNDESLYSFIFTYPINVFDRDLLRFIKPKYPWKTNLFVDLANNIKNERFYIETIDKQKKKIEELEKKLKDIK